MDDRKNGRSVVSSRVRNTDEKISQIKDRLAEIEEERRRLTAELTRLNREEEPHSPPQVVREPDSSSVVHKLSSSDEKIRLFRSLFQGREDVYPRRWESTKTGRSGYSPACRNEWVPGICEKPKVKCGDCSVRDLLPVTDAAIRDHLVGHGQNDQRDFTIGVYPLLPDETCWFLAVDFDKETWSDDAQAYLQTCGDQGIPATLERSRSGNGGHVWIFFSGPVPAAEARRLGAWMISETMERMPGLGFESYDRMFPNQDTLPAGGFGNLIALPLQGRSRKDGNTVFLDTDLVPFDDQWLHLSNVLRLATRAVHEMSREAWDRGQVVPIRRALTEECDKPWDSPSRDSREPDRGSGSAPRGSCAGQPDLHLQRRSSSSPGYACDPAGGIPEPGVLQRSGDASLDLRETESHQLRRGLQRSHRSTPWLRRRSGRTAAAISASRFG